MKLRKARLAAACGAIALSQTGFAGTEPYFVPLTESAPVTAANSNEELTAPWVAPAGFTHTNLTSLDEVEGDITQSIVRVPGLGSNASMFDMIAFDPTGKYLFIPHETAYGAGVTRYSLDDDTATTLFRGDGKGLNNVDWSNDWGAFDPASWTPNGTLLVAEEWSGLGRVIEVLNPMADPADIRKRELKMIPNVSHEGLRFSRNGNVLYFIDEDNSGSIYKIVFKNKHRYGQGGQVFVLKVDAFEGDPALTWNDPANVTQSRFGTATWVPVTDANGVALTEVDPFLNGTEPADRPGRVAADELGGTPYGRPEDVEVGRLANGRVVLYFAATSEQAIYSVVMNGKYKATVRMLASESGTPKNLGFAPTSGTLSSPDNLAQDSQGNIYVVEDKPNSDTTGGDVWFVRDVNSDGVAESLDHFLSLRVAGSESTGMIFNPAKPGEFAIAVQHPASADLGTVPEGFGDALWVFDISEAQAP